MKQLKTPAFKVILFALAIAATGGCKKDEMQAKKNSQSLSVADASDTKSASGFDASVAISWITMQENLSKTTPGFDPGATGRTFGFSGLALYEAVEPGIPGYQSIAPQLSGGLALPAANPDSGYYWPAAANASMSYIIKNLFANTSAANTSSIDSLEADYNTKFSSEVHPAKLQRSIAFGKAIASAIFNWSKTDGGDQPYLHAVDSGYVWPKGPGLWVPTAPFFGYPVRPHWGDNRSMIPNVATLAAMPAPVAYSETFGSPFYTMANNLYHISQSLTHDDTITVKFWADLAGQYNGPSHFTNVLTQLIVLNHLNLAQAAVAYAKHGIAINDASIACFKSKYTYNLIRPISYIQTVLKHPTWSTVIITPPHPEYVSAHASIMQSCAEVLRNIFGANYEFDDHTNDALYGTRHYKSFNAYAKEGAMSRILAGIHYRPSAEAGIQQGRIVGGLVNDLQFKK